MKLIKEQIEAKVFGEGFHDLAISAGAGAGKTGVLVERYLHAITEYGETPSQLLTITFTRRAAAEMKRRIVERLRAEGLHDLAREAQVGPISTIHGYCERLLREYPFDAGLDPRFEILTPKASNQLIANCCAEVLADTKSLAACESDLLRLRGIRTYTGDRPETIEAWVVKTVTDFRVAGKRPEDLERLAESPENVRTAWAEFMCGLAAEAGIEPEAGWLIDGIKQGGAAWMRAKGNEDVESRCARATQGLASLAARTWRKFIASLDRSAALDFSELETRALRLLESKPEIIEGKYTRLLIDEAQDLNPVQYALIRATPVNQMLLVGDAQQSIYSFRGAKRELFLEYLKDAQTRRLVVNWRSTPLLIKCMRSLFERTWGDAYMRMRPSNVSRDSDDPFEDPSEGPPVEIWKAESASTAIASGMREWVASDEVKPSDVTILIRSAQKLEEIVRSMRAHDLEPKILGAGSRYFLRNEIRDLGSALLAAADPHNDVALLSLMRSPLVGISLDGCLRSLGQARDEGRSVFSSLTRSQPLNDVDAKRWSELLRWLRPVSEIADYVPAWEVLSRVLADTQADLRFAMSPNAAQLIANSRKLLQIAIENRDMSAADFGEWITNQQSFRLSGADALSDAEYSDAADGRPSIATMHTAKGLEWDVVVVDATQKRYSTAGHDLRINAFAGVLAVALRDAGALENNRLVPRAHAALAHEADQADAEEVRRLMYVAMTRAKKRLAIVADAAKSGAFVTDILTGLAPRWQGSQDVVVKDFTQAAIASGSGALD